MKNVRLENGLNLKVKDGALDNMELLDDLVALDEGNGYALSRILGRVLEPEEKKKLYDHLREDGITKVSSITKALKEIFDKLGEQGKN